MPNIRYKPRWLTFLIPVLLVLAALGAPGCSGDNKKRSAPPPVYSQEAGIASITLNKGSLNPPYSDKVRNYSAGPFYVEASDFSLTVTLKDAKAKLTINGNQAGSGAAFPVAPGSVKPEDFRFIPPGVNHIEAAINDVRTLLVTVMAESWMDSELPPGAVLVNLDAPVAVGSLYTEEDDYIPSGGCDMDEKQVLYNGKYYYRSTRFWNLWLEGQDICLPHRVDIVAYDRTNNRTEQRFYVTVTDANAHAADDPGLGSVTPTINSLYARTRGLTTDR